MQVVKSLCLSSLQDTIGFRFVFSVNMIFFLLNPDISRLFFPIILDFWIKIQNVDYFFSFYISPHFLM